MSDYSFTDYIGSRKYEIELDDEGELHRHLMSLVEIEADDRCFDHCPSDMWSCTLTEGHSGSHIGANEDEIVGMWENEDDDGGPTVTPVERKVSEPFDPMGWLSDD